MQKYVVLIIKNSQSTTEESQPWDETNTIYGRTEKPTESGSLVTLLNLSVN